MNEKVHEDHQECTMNKKKLLNHQRLSRVHSSMQQEKQDHQKTET